MYDRPFKPLLTRAIAGTSDAALTAFSQGQDILARANQAAVFSGSSDSALFVAFESSSVAASAPAAGNSVNGILPVPPNQQVLISIPWGAAPPISAAYAAGGSATFYVPPGTVETNARLSNGRTTATACHARPS